MSVWWSFALSGTALWATWLIGRKKRSGWLVNVLLNVAWIVYAVLSSQWGFAASALVFVATCIHNYVLWGAEEHEAAKVSAAHDAVR